MRLGISGNLKHVSAEEWAEKLRDLGCGAVVFPCDHHTEETKIEAYVQACRDYDLVIAEVGAWCSPLHVNSQERAKNLRYCQEQLRLAERIGAKCCVNIAGSCGEIWDGGYAENYSEATYQRIVETVREIIDAVNPARTCYTLEPMPWMVPDGPESYLQLLKDVNRSGFAVHLDIVNMISCPDRYFFNTRFIEKCFHLLGPFIKSCHVKDVRLEHFLTFNLKEVACGQGALDIVRYMQLADAANPDIPFIIEHLNTEEEYIAAVRYIRNLSAGV
jgi:sugar phosphate isomerase/epimerase